MKIIFHPKYKKGARLWAILWTLLIFVLCFLPAKEIPDVRVPMADKWVHFVLFGVFSFLWLLSFPKFAARHLLLVLVCAVLLGWLVELLQGQLIFLGRSQDNMDTLADGIGGLMGVVLFWLLHKLNNHRSGT